MKQSILTNMQLHWSYRSMIGSIFHEYPYTTMRRVKGGLHQAVVQVFRTREDREEYDKYHHTVLPEEVYYHELQSQVHLKD